MCQNLCSSYDYLQLVSVVIISITYTLLQTPTGESLKPQTQRSHRGRRPKNKIKQTCENVFSYDCFVVVSVIIVVLGVVVAVIIINDPRRGCYMVWPAFIFFFFFFFSATALSAPYLWNRHS